MNAFLRTVVLRLLRVPHEPAPPAGAPGSLRVFRAGKNFWRLRLLSWGGKQVVAAIGILASIFFIDHLEMQRGRETPPAMVQTRDQAYAKIDRVAPTAVAQLVRKIPTDLVSWMRLAESFAILGYCIQFPLTLVAARLDFSYRWYMVTDRSLRLRYGLTTVHEATMSFANVQQVKVNQGPLQRLLGLADVEVESAGGGGGGERKGQQRHAEQESMHRGVFRGVENAGEIRDLILARLQRFREAGLGDPDDAHDSSAPTGAAGGPPPLPPTTGEVTAAAMELLVEARNLRASWAAETRR